VRYGKRANLKEAGKSFQHVYTSYLLNDEYYNCITGDATVTVSYKCSMTS